MNLNWIERGIMLQALTDFLESSFVLDGQIVSSTKAKVVGLEETARRLLERLQEESKKG